MKGASMFRPLSSELSMGVRGAKDKRYLKRLFGRTVLGIHTLCGCPRAAAAPRGRVIHRPLISPVCENSRPYGVKLGGALTSVEPNPGGVRKKKLHLRLLRSVLLIMLRNYASGTFDISEKPGRSTRNFDLPTENRTSHPTKVQQDQQLTRNTYIKQFYCVLPVLVLGKGASRTTMHVDTSSMMLSAVKLTWFQRKPAEAVQAFKSSRSQP